MQEKPSKACFRTTRGLDAADAVHSCFFSEGVFRGALKIAESAPHNKGNDKEFIGVGGHLFAIAVQRSY